MNRPLDLRSTVAKINRAYQHLRVLDEEIRDFVGPDLYEIRTESYRRGREWCQYTRRQVEELGLKRAYRFRQVDNDTLEVRRFVDYQRVTATLQRQPDMIRWAVLIGDILNNARGALDNLVWALTDAQKGPPPSPIPRSRGPNNWRNVRFPIATSPASWKNAVTTNLWGLRPRQIARLKKLQPFYRRKYPERHWLAVLDELWNGDKHRAVHIVRMYHGWSSIDIGPPDLLDIMEVRIIRRRPYGPFVNDTEEIARFRTSPRSDRLFRRVQVNMRVNVHLMFEIAFDEGPPAYGSGIMELLQSHLDSITAIVADFQPNR